MPSPPWIPMWTAVPARCKTAMAPGSYTRTVYPASHRLGRLLQNVANCNFWWNPIDDLVVVPSIRAEWEDHSRPSRSSSATGGEYGPAAFAPIPTICRTSPSRLKSATPGSHDLVLYAKGDWTQGDVDRRLRIALNEQFRCADTDIEDEKYSVGANWYPVSGLSVAAQYYYRNFEEDFDVRLHGPLRCPASTITAADTNEFQHPHDMARDAKPHVCHPL